MNYQSEEDIQKESFVNGLSVINWVVMIVTFPVRNFYKFKGDILNPSESCKELIDNFANSSARFMFCSLQNARPIHMCCSCVDEYNTVLEEHTKIVELKENSSCKEKLINQDRLEVIENGFLYIKGLWEKGHCKNCFENKNTLSNTTKEFIKLHSVVKKCLENNYDDDDNYNALNKSYYSNVCLLCSKEYYKMSKYYTTLKEASGNGNVCMDIVDSVNATQHLWSNILHCRETVMTFEIPLIAISSAFFIIPLFFYICAWKFTKDRSSAVLNQNRVSQRFQEKWRSRTGSHISN